MTNKNQIRIRGLAQKLQNPTMRGVRHAQNLLRNFCDARPRRVLQFGACPLSEQLARSLSKGKLFACVLRKIFAIICFVIFLYNTPLQAAEQTEPNNLTSFRHAFYPEKAKFVFEFAQNPIYNIYLSDDQKEITVEFVNACISPEFKLEDLKYDYLVSNIKDEIINFRSFRFTVKLKHKITQANIQETVLKEPYRLAIDIFREYTVNQNIKLTKNISLKQSLVMGLKDKLLINELLIDKNAPEVSFKVVLANDDTKSRGKLSEMAAKEGALAAINGGYFARDGGPLGLIIIDGKIVSENIKKRPPRTSFGLTADKKFIFDRIYAQDDKISTKDGTDWNNVVYAIGAGPRLIKDGEINITAPEEELAKNGNDITKKAGRSAIGLTAENKLILMTVSGYTSNEGQGIGLYSLAARLQSLGAAQAMNLDGGGSALMWIDGGIISKPPEAPNNFERKIADAFLVFDSSPNLLPQNIKIEVIPAQIIADGTSEISVNAFVYDKNGGLVPDSTPVLFKAEAGRISVSAKTINGMAHAYLKSGRKLGPAKVTACCGFIENSVNILFEPDKPAYMFTNVVKDQNNAGDCHDRPSDNKYNLQVLVNDKYYNPIAGKQVVFKIGDEETSAITGDNGIAQINVVNDTGEPIPVIIESEGLEKIEVKVPAD